VPHTASTQSSRAAHAGGVRELTKSDSTKMSPGSEALRARSCTKIADMLRARSIGLVALAILVAVSLQALSVSSVHAQAQPSASPLMAAALRRSSTVSRTGVERSSLPRQPIDDPRPHSALLISGASTFLSSYLMSVFFGVMIHILFGEDCEHGSSTCSRANSLFIPLIGPLLSTDSLDAGMRTFLVASQALGLVVTIVGGWVLALTSGRSILPASTEPTRASLRVSVAPSASGPLLTAALTF
jgi:hypothetical protein